MLNQYTKHFVRSATVIAGLSMATGLFALNPNDVHGTYITSQSVLQNVSSQYYDFIMGRVDAIRSGNAMRDHHSAGLWVNGAWTGTENDRASMEFDGDFYTGIIGADMKLDNSMWIGLGLGYEDNDIDTTFNLGKVEGTGITVLPYMVFDMGDGFLADLSVGYTFGEYDLLRADPAATTTIYTAEPDFTRWHVALNFSKDCVYENYLMNGRFGLFYGREKVDDFIETGSAVVVADQTTKLASARAGGTFGYDMGSVVPYVGANLIWDFSDDHISDIDASLSQPSNDPFAAEFSLGLTMKMSAHVSGRIEGKTEQFRSDYNRDSVFASIRWDM